MNNQNKTSKKNNFRFWNIKFNLKSHRDPGYPLSPMTNDFYLPMFGLTGVTETTILVSVQNRNPNWLILSADTGTDTETTFQRENLVTNSMEYFF